MNINDNAEFFVSFSEAGVKHTFTKAFEEDAVVTWKEVLGDFLKFLDNAYGYSVSSQVEYPEETDWAAMAQVELNFGGTD